MKCVAIKDKRLLEVTEIPEPLPKKDRVLIKVLKAGICGSDIHYFESGAPKGLVMGHEFSGIVIDAGDRKDLRVGDRVTGLPISPCGHCEACKTGNVQYCPETWNHAVGLALDNNGAYSEKISVRSDMVLKLPKSITDDEAAMVEPTAVALHAVHLANVKIGNKVLIIGGGIIGLLCAELAKLEGASYVAMTETNEARGKKALKLKAVDEYFNATDSELSKKIAKKTNNGFDVVIDCCGNSPAVTSALLYTKNGGTLVLVGVSLTPVTIPTVLGVMHELKIFGSIAYTKEEFAACIDLIANNQLNIIKFLDDIVPLNKAQEAFERLTSGKDDAVKIIINPNL